MIPHVQPASPLLSRRSFTRAAVAAALLPAAWPAHAQISMATAINRTARFRALSQRCAKAYAQVYLEVLPEDAREVITTAQRLIQVGFEDLGKAALKGPAAQQLTVVQQEHASLTQMLALPPSKQAVTSVSVQADRMLMAANKATELLEQQSRGQASAKLVNMAGRQRMLSQRLAKNYFLIAAGQDAKPARDQIAGDRSDFIAAMETLTEAPLSTQTIRNELQLAQQQWVLYDAALARKPDTNALNTVATTSERVLQVMNNLTGLYEAALRDLLGST